MLQIKLGWDATLSASDNITNYLPFEPRQSPITLGSNQTQALDGSIRYDGAQTASFTIAGITHNELDTFMQAFYSGWSANNSVKVTVCWLDNDYTYTTANAWLHPLTTEDYTPVWRDQLRDVTFNFDILR